jgi:hypothetical protein
MNKKISNAPGHDTDSTTLDPAALAAVHGGMIPIPNGGGGGGSPINYLGGITQLGNVNKKPPRCENWRTWMSPQALALTTDGHVARFPTLSCPQLKVVRK